MKNRRILGIAGLLFAIMLITSIFNQAFLSAYNIKNLMRWTGLFGLVSIGAGFVIMTGGIDLSVGSIIGLIGVIFANVLKVHRWSIPSALLGSTGSRSSPSFSDMASNRVRRISNSSSTRASKPSVTVSERRSSICRTIKDTLKPMSPMQTTSRKMKSISPKPIPPNSHSTFWLRSFLGCRLMCRRRPTAFKAFITAAGNRFEAVIQAREHIPKS